MRSKTAVIVYLVADVLCVGMGMGVPIFCIALGFPTGWIIVRRTVRARDDLVDVLPMILAISVATSLVTLLMMLAIWGPFFFKLFDPTASLENTGIPMILYEPRASFVGWHILMVVISPFLQLLATVFGANLALIALTRKGSGT